MLAVDLCLCKYPYLVHAPRYCLKPGRTHDHVGQLSTQLGALHKSGFHLLAYARIWATSAPVDLGPIWKALPTIIKAHPL